MSKPSAVKIRIKENNKIPESEITSVLFTIILTIPSFDCKKLESKTQRLPFITKYERERLLKNKDRRRS